MKFPLSAPLVVFISDRNWPHSCGRGWSSLVPPFPTPKYVSLLSILAGGLCAISFNGEEVISSAAPASQGLNSPRTFHDINQVD